MNFFYIIQLLTNLGLTLSTLFIPLFAEELKASPFEIGIIVSAYNGSLFVSSFIFGRIADIYGKKRVIMTGLLAASIIFAGQIFIYDIRSMLVMRILTGLAAGVFPAALTTLVFETGGPLGRYSALGSLGWAMGGLIAGFVKGYNALFLLSSAVFLVSFSSSLKIREREARIEGRLFSFDVLRKNFREYFSFLLRHTGAMGVWAVYPLFLQALGADKMWIGIIYSLNPLFQFVFMQIVDRFRGRVMIDIGLILSVATFSLYAACTNHYQVLMAQIVLALSWSFLYLGELKHLLHSNVERVTAVGTFNSMMGLAGVFGPVLGGAVSQYGFTALMLYAAGMTLLGFAVLKIKF